MIITLSSDKGIRQFSISKFLKNVILFMILLVIFGVIGVVYYAKELSKDVLLLKQQNKTFVMQTNAQETLEQKHQELVLALEKLKDEKTIEAETFNIQIKNLKEEKQRIEKEKQAIISRSTQLIKEEKAKKIVQLRLERERKKRIEERKLAAKKKELDKKDQLKQKIVKKEEKRTNLLYNIAKKKLGRPYVWGAVGPVVFDCSGFTSYVYKKTGLNIPRTSRNQSKYGKRIKRKELKQGDLIFFDTSRPSKGFVNHVGIYIGNNKFIHASSAQKKVVITSLSKPFYSKRYKGARRVTY